uniref:Hepcidin n=1 Tax=Jaculus jaculus TaxID=51337 RepID=A0A8C5K9I9_JACJA|nr:hepcidin [Jaculus jaculus]
MALTSQIQATCLLLLLLIASLTSGASLQPQMGQPAELQPRRTSEAEASLTPLFQRLKRRDTHLSICTFCCKCCHNENCGFCCKT